MNYKRTITAMEPEVKERWLARRKERKRSSRVLKSVKTRYDSSICYKFRVVEPVVRRKNPELKKAYEEFGRERARLKRLKKEGHSGKM